VSPLPVIAAAAAGTAFLLLAAHPAQGSIEMVPGAIVSQPFGCTGLELEPVDPACPGGHFHSGIDLAAPSGTPVLAPGGGVARVAAGGPCGIHVLLQHGAGIETLFCHLSAAAVADGAAVGPGQLIGRIGATGLATGPHLHFVVHRNGRAVDPAAWLRRIPATTNLHGGM
jgi:murein DD-endopeptidase MepM/ murein hydrolase activator NlpD